MESLFDPGSSATIMSFDTFKRVRRRAGIGQKDLCPPDVVLRIYSQQPIAIGSLVDMEVAWRGKSVTSPVYVRSEREKGEPLLLGTNVIGALEMMQLGAGVVAKPGGEESRRSGSAPGQD